MCLDGIFLEGSPEDKSVLRDPRDAHLDEGPEVFPVRDGPFCDNAEHDHLLGPKYLEALQK